MKTIDLRPLIAVPFTRLPGPAAFGVTIIAIHLDPPDEDDTPLSLVSLSTN